MKDIVDRLEKRTKYLWRAAFFGSALFFGITFEGDYKEYLTWSVFFVFFVIDHLIGYAIRLMYKIEPSAIIDIVKSMGITGIHKGIDTYGYSEDYIRSYWFFPEESKAYTYYKRDRYGFNTPDDYKFMYISLYDKKKRNNDKIEVYKMLTRSRYIKKTTDNLKTMELSIKLELSYINDQFVLKNHYNRDDVASLHVDEAFSYFHKFVEDIKVLFDPVDFYHFMKDSSFELEISTKIKRNLLVSSKTDGIKKYRLNVKWADNIGSLKLGKFRWCFKDGSAIEFHDYSELISDCKKKNKPLPAWLVIDKYYVSTIFNRLISIYSDKLGEYAVYSDSEVIEKWKKIVIKEKLKMKKRIEVLKNKVKQRTYKKVKPEDIKFWENRSLKKQLNSTKRIIKLKKKINKRTYKVNVSINK